MTVATAIIPRQAVDTSVGFRFDPLPKFLSEWIRNGHLKPIDVLVLKHMLDFRRLFKFSCWTTRKTIAAKIGCSTRTVQRSWDRLEACGAIRAYRVPRPDPDEPSNRTGWRFIFPWLLPEGSEPPGPPKLRCGKGQKRGLRQVCEETRMSPSEETVLSPNSYADGSNLRPDGIEQDGSSSSSWDRSATGPKSLRGDDDNPLRSWKEEDSREGRSVAAPARAQEAHHAIPVSDGGLPIPAAPVAPRAAQATPGPEEQAVLAFVEATWPKQAERFKAKVPAIAAMLEAQVGAIVAAWVVVLELLHRMARSRKPVVNLVRYLEAAAWNEVPDIRNAGRLFIEPEAPGKAAPGPDSVAAIVGELRAAGVRFWVRGDTILHHCQGNDRAEALLKERAALIKARKSEFLEFLRE